MKAVPFEYLIKESKSHGINKPYILQNGLFDFNLPLDVSRICWKGWNLSLYKLKNNHAKALPSTMDPNEVESKIME